MKTADSSRIAWLDGLRWLCALEILGFHWLRAVFATGLLPFGSPTTHVMHYRDVDLGLRQFSYLAIDRTDSGPVSIINNILGVLFGFGWEAVNVFVMLSGIVLAMSYDKHQHGRTTVWLWRRFKRILLPYYVVALPLVLLAYGVSTGLGGDLGSSFIAAKIAAMIPEPFLQGFLKHLILLDPAKRHWVAAFFAPAWWFVPALLAGYCAFPALYALQRRLGWRFALASSVLISIVSQVLVHNKVLVDNAWYLFVTTELANFMLGIVIGRAVTEPVHLQALHSMLRSNILLVGALLLVLLGNMLNWSIATAPVGTLLFTPGLAFLFARISLGLCELPLFSRTVRRVDAYHIYLLHQPLAFPCALLIGKLTDVWAPAIGLLVYLVVVAMAVVLYERILGSRAFYAKQSGSRSGGEHAST